MMVSMVEWRDCLYGENGLNAAIERLIVLRNRAVEGYESCDAVAAECVVGVAFAAEHVGDLAGIMAGLGAALGGVRRDLADQFFDSLD